MSLAGFATDRKSWCSGGRLLSGHNTEDLRWAQDATWEGMDPGTALSQRSFALGALRLSSLARRASSASEYMVPRQSLLPQ